MNLKCIIQKANMMHMCIHCPFKSLWVLSDRPSNHRQPSFLLPSLSDPSCSFITSHVYQCPATLQPQMLSM